MSSEGNRRRSRPSPASIVVVLCMLVPIVYVLSYAPVVRFCEGPDPRNDYTQLYNELYGAQPDEYPFYRPVNWLIDNTPLCEPLLFWANLWCVRETFEQRGGLGVSWSGRPNGSSTVASMRSDGGALPARDKGENLDSSWQETAKLTSKDASAWMFGDAIAVSGETLLVGATEYEGRLSMCSAYFFEQEPNGSWQEAGKVTLRDDTHSIECKSVSISGGRALIGASGTGLSTDKFGAVYVLEHQADESWRQTAKLSNRYFGLAVAIVDDRAIVGAPHDQQGAVYIFEHQPDGTWLQIAELTPNEGAPETEFGRSVSMTPGRALVGVDSGHRGDGSIGASAYVFDRQSDGAWQQTARLILIDRTHGGLMGTSVVLTESEAIVGVNWSDDRLGESGAAYVFEQRDEGTWHQVATLVPRSATMGNFLVKVSATEGRAIVGSQGSTNYSQWTESAWIFDRQEDESWRPTDQLIPRDGAEEYIFGMPVILDGERAFVGAPRDIDGNGNLPGAVYVFEPSRR